MSPCLGQTIMSLVSFQNVCTSCLVSQNVWTTTCLMSLNVWTMHVQCRFRMSLSPSLPLSPSLSPSLPLSPTASHPGSVFLYQCSSKESSYCFTSNNSSLASTTSAGSANLICAIHPAPIGSSLINCGLLSKTSLMAITSPATGL